MRLVTGCLHSTPLQFLAAESNMNSIQNITIQRAVKEYFNFQIVNEDNPILKILSAPICRRLKNVKTWRIWIRNIQTNFGINLRLQNPIHQNFLVEKSFKSIVNYDMLEKYPVKRYLNNEHLSKIKDEISQKIKFSDFSIFTDGSYCPQTDASGCSFILMDGDGAMITKKSTRISDKTKPFESELFALNLSIRELIVKIKEKEKFGKK